MTRADCLQSVADGPQTEGPHCGWLTTRFAARRAAWKMKGHKRKMKSQGKTNSFVRMGCIAGEHAALTIQPNLDPTSKHSLPIVLANLSADGPTEPEPHIKNASGRVKTTNHSGKVDPDEHVRINRRQKCMSLGSACHAVAHSPL